ESISHVRLSAPRERRSVTNAAFGVAQVIPPYLYSVSKRRAGAPVKGAARSDTRSRFGTFTRGSPLSSASTVTSVAGASDLQLTARIPGVTASLMLGSSCATGD